MKINLIVVGKLRPEWNAIFKIYHKKIAFYAALNILQIKEIKDKNIALRIEKETQLILHAIPKNSPVILCSLKGPKKTSVEFSKILTTDNVTFVIGGSDGVNEKYFPNKIAFSDLTFPHQMFRIILIEQIYRGLSILNNTRYHK